MEPGIHEIIGKPMLLGDTNTMTRRPTKEQTDTEHQK
jgi:hypothetical protein